MLLSCLVIIGPHQATPTSQILMICSLSTWRSSGIGHPSDLRRRRIHILLNPFLQIASIFDMSWDQPSQSDLKFCVLSQLQYFPHILLKFQASSHNFCGCWTTLPWSLLVSGAFFVLHSTLLLDLFQAWSCWIGQAGSGGAGTGFLVLSIFCLLFIGCVLVSPMALWLDLGPTLSIIKQKIQKPSGQPYLHRQKCPILWIFWICILFTIFLLTSIQ